MHIEEFNYSLPDHLIAQRPPEKRGDSRLMVVKKNGDLFHNHFGSLLENLRSGDLLVFNDTKVIPARCYGVKPSGGKIEIFLERILDENCALVQLRTSKKIKDGLIFLLGEYRGEVLENRNGMFCVQFNDDVLKIFDQEGHVPLPPYIQRQDDEHDVHRYQTLLAKNPGAVAAPTASLHFTQSMLDAFQMQNIDTATITLHVGAGTYQPVRVDNIAEHTMHAERMIINPDTANKIVETRQKGGRVVAVGTTVVRALESAGSSTGIVTPGAYDTEIFIYPGYHFNVVDLIITNFHLPKSTLLMMVSAFAGKDRIRLAYQQAIESEYRFFSYGDAMLLEKAE